MVLFKQIDTGDLPMDISKIGYGENPDAVKAIIEVPLNSAIKYEIDKDSGVLEVDRVLYSSMHYTPQTTVLFPTHSQTMETQLTFLYSVTTHYKQVLSLPVNLLVYF